MSLTKESAAFDAFAHGHLVTDERDTDQLYFEYIHDQACIKRDAVMKVIEDNWFDMAHLSDALYEHFYEQTKRKP